MVLFEKKIKKICKTAVVQLLFDDWALYDRWESTKINSSRNVYETAPRCCASTASRFNKRSGILLFTRVNVKRILYYYCRGRKLIRFKRVFFRLPRADRRRRRCHSRFDNFCRGAPTCHLRIGIIIIWLRVCLLRRKPKAQPRVNLTVEKPYGGGCWNTVPNLRCRVQSDLW